MITYYLKNSILRILKHSGFSALNIIGLTLGISSCLLIILYVNFELGFDKFHENYSKIYRIVMKQPGNQVVGSSSDWWIVAPYILKPTWEKDLPEIELATRTQERTWTFKCNDQFTDESILTVDPEFFDIFTFPLKSGNKKDVLSQPFSIVLSESMAQKYFGNSNPVGKTLLRNNGMVFNVTGVFKEVPENSHLKFDFLVSFQTVEKILGKSLISDNWGDNGYPTYLVLKENIDFQQLDTKLRKYDMKLRNNNIWSFHLQPLSDIHFNRQIQGTGNKGTLFIFISVGFFILFIAGFNYMNLFVAHYRARIKDIGIKRVLGVSRIQLALHFLSESFLLVFISYLVSYALVWLVLPLFNNFIGEKLDYSSLMTTKVIISGFGAILLLTVIAGLYPSFYLSGLKIIDGIKGGMEKFSKSAMIVRKGVVVIQFSVSILLLIGTITVYEQLDFVNRKSLGFDKDQILYMTLRGLRYKDKDGIWQTRLETFKQELLKNSNIIQVSASSGIPSKIGWSNQPTWEGQKEDEKPFIYRINVDENFLDLYGIELAMGRGFSVNLNAEIGKAFILNEAAVKSLDIKTPIGVRFGFWEGPGSIVGVVKDFHFESLHKPITPLGICFANSDNFNYLSVKIANSNIPETINYIENKWNSLTTNVPIKYSFLNEQLNQLYKKDKQLAESMNYFSFMAIFISCLGIFGMMSIAIKERTRELGIRKVMGVSFLQLLYVLSKDTIIIMFFSSILGGILGWYMALQWLMNFAYRIDFRFEIIIISSLVILIMAMIPVIIKIVKAYRINPVDVLRNE